MILHRDIMLQIADLSMQIDTLEAMLVDQGVSLHKIQVELANMRSNKTQDAVKHNKTAKK